MRRIVTDAQSYAIVFNIVMAMHIIKYQYAA